MAWLTTCTMRCGALNRSATSAASLPPSTAYGMTLLRAEDESRHDALDVLERVRTGIQKYKMFTFALATIDAVLEIDAAGKGNWTRQSMSFVPLSRCR